MIANQRRSEMSQIFRMIKPEMIQICRFYGTSRNLHNHYETLRVSSDATPKDIRQAFLKLSKEMHPDLSKNPSHADFVKVNEAYTVLSKENTRRLYDMELSNRGANGRPTRVVYYDPSVKGWPRHAKHRDPNDDNYYGIKGVKKLSNVTIVFLCLIFSAVGLVVQLFAINKSFVFQRDMLLAKSVKYAEAYKQVRIEAESKDNEQRIADFEEILATSHDDTGVGLQR